MAELIALAMPRNVEGAVAAKAVLRVALSVLLSLLGFEASAERRLPIDVEPKAAYCSGILKYQLNENWPIVIEWRQKARQLDAESHSSSAALSPSLRAVEDAERTRYRQIIRDVSTTTEEHQKKLDSAFNRIQRYLLPKLEYLDITPLTAATDQAQADLKQNQYIGEACGKSCDGAKDRVQCMSDCLNRGGLTPKFRSCFATDWLPF